MDLHIIRFSSAFVRFVRFFFSMKKYVPFRPHFYMSISALSRLSHTRPKYFEQKKIVNAALFWNIAPIGSYAKFLSTYNILLSADMD